MKKISTPFDQFDPSAALLMINMVDPQVATMMVFLEAIAEKKLPFFAIGNKMDAPEHKDIAEIEKSLGIDILPVSVLSGAGIDTVNKKIETTFTQDAKIAVLGVFNSGKTSLIASLTGKTLKISDLPGTTLEFTEHEFNGRTLIDTVGQVIDVSKPMMVSIDLSGCKTTEEKIATIFRQEAAGILASLETALHSIKEVVKVMKQQIAAGHKIIITGAGASALVAKEAAGQGRETGVPIMVFTNDLGDAQPVSFSKGLGEEEMGISKYTNLAVNKDDIVIGVSASGGTGFVYDTLRRAKQKEAICVAITENIDTPVGKAADYVIKSNAKPEGPSSSKIQVAHLVIVHALLLTLAEERGITADESVNFMLPETVATKKMGIK
jgi:D-arabinose 5-phosphate isomerase GutQ